MHEEFNVGAPGIGSGSLSADFDFAGNFVGGQFFVRGPNIGPGGLMAGAGVQSTITLATPTLGQLWERVKNRLRRVYRPVAIAQGGVCRP